MKDQEYTIEDALLLNVLSVFKRKIGIINPLVDVFKKELNTKDKVEHFLSAFRKYTFLLEALDKINELIKEKNLSKAVEVEYNFYAGVFFAVSSLDSLACLINDFYSIADEDKCSLNSGEFTKKLPDFVAKITTPFNQQLKELFKYRNMLAHRRAFIVVPVGPKPDKIQGFKVPAKSTTKLTELKSFKEELAEVIDLLSEFEQLVGEILVRTIVNWPSQKLNKLVD